MKIFGLKSRYDEEGIVSPLNYIKYNLGGKIELKNKPTKYILVHYSYLLDYFRKKYNPKEIKVTRLLTIYQYKDIALVGLIGVGAPNAVRLLEELIVLGGKEFYDIGVAGGLDTSGIFLCQKALVDEGTTSHYLSRAKYTFADKALTLKLGKALEKNNLKFTVADSWTIDALYREVPSKVRKHKKMGIKTVEMEASALFAVAQLRNVQLGACFVVSDILTEDGWEPQYHNKEVKETLNKIIDASIESFSS